MNWGRVDLGGLEKNIAGDARLAQTVMCRNGIELLQYNRNYCSFVIFSATEITAKLNYKQISTERQRTNCKPSFNADSVK